MQEIRQSMEIEKVLRKEASKLNFPLHDKYTNVSI